LLLVFLSGLNSPRGTSLQPKIYHSLYTIKLYVHTAFGIDTDAFKKMRLSFNKGLGLLAKTGKGYIIHDYLSDKRVEESLSLYWVKIYGG